MQSGPGHKAWYKSWVAQHRWLIAPVLSRPLVRNGAGNTPRSRGAWQIAPAGSTSPCSTSFGNWGQRTHDRQGRGVARLPTPLQLAPQRGREPEFNQAVRPKTDPAQGSPPLPM
ncbi:conserved hypothetical protein [Mesorhizobium escarrei]|uniref:Uncharacterized protein n=1 Tax=Mesorhizobium escarrei TaxID=666018 RepID=A0ABM9DZR3_9HYPH|nr:conserved hypothetical protein [Mesorhizobium escarrei]